jgi:hypothetical protein
MKFDFRRSAVPLMFVAGLLLLSSCASTQHAGVGRKFKDTASANLVIRYASDQTIFMLKPDGHDGLFFRIFNRDELCAMDTSRTGSRELAVVVIGYNYLPETEQVIRDGWVESLAKLNYRRIVFLRFSEGKEVDDLRVIDERQLAATGTPPGYPQLASATPP